MYVPKYFRETDESEIFDFINSNKFATLVSTSDTGELLASHIPLELERGRRGSSLSGHLAKANPQWRSLENAKEVLAIFQGPDAYISPTWYAQPNVPTWNYVSAHVYGVPSLVENDADLLKLVTQQVEQQESPDTSDYSVGGLPADLLKKELRGIVGFRIQISRTVASHKLSQNRDARDHQNIVRELEARGDERSQQVASFMRRSSSRRDCPGPTPDSISKKDRQL